jgi:predicted DNA-binding protein (UPF0278 family)
MKAPIRARMAAMAPKTMPTQLALIKALRKTHTPREQIARLENFTVRGPPLTFVISVTAALAYGYT